MKPLSERYFEKNFKDSEHGDAEYISTYKQQIKIYGEFKYLEGKIKSLNSFGTNNWVEKSLPKYRNQLRKLAKENNLI